MEQGGIVPGGNQGFSRIPLNSPPALFASFTHLESFLTLHLSFVILFYHFLFFRIPSASFLPSSASRRDNIISALCLIISLYCNELQTAIFIVMSPFVVAMDAPEQGLLIPQ